MRSSTITPEIRQKQLGAFYTPSNMASVMAEWAIRDPNEQALDAAFGGMVFLEAVSSRLESLGARHAPSQVFGVDIDEEAISSSAQHAMTGANLVHADFLDLTPDCELPRVEVAIGNPPYVRYQLYDGARGLEIAAQHGVKLTRLASSWAPMLIHLCDFVLPGGRIAQVLPAEILHAQYASDVLRFICDQFSDVKLVMFDEHVFPGAQEEVVLLFAEGKEQGRSTEVEVISVQNVNSLSNSNGLPRGVRTELEHKLIAGLVSERAITTYDRLRESDLTRTLGDLARVDIGAVTGANRFFVRPAAEVEHLDDDILRRAVSKATHVPGARLNEDDFLAMDERGAPSRMLVIDGTKSLSDDVETLVREGETMGVHERYKCRIRTPWYSLPTKQVSDPPPLLLTYMSSHFPRLSTNDAGALSTNSVHGVRLHNGTNPSGLAASFYTSLTLLSAELVGRSYGGGVLKLEPSEAERLVLARPSEAHAALIEDVDRLLRQRRHEELQTLVDKAILVDDLGMSESDVSELRTAATRLRQRRKSRASQSRT